MCTVLVNIGIKGNVAADQIAKQAIGLPGMATIHTTIRLLGEVEPPNGKGSVKLILVI